MDDIGILRRPIVPERLGARRALVLALVLGSWAALGLVMAHVIFGKGWGGAGWAGAVVMALFLIGLPWTLLAFWNSVIGFVILRATRNPASYTNPALRATEPLAPIMSRTAICIAIRHEDVDRVAGRLAIMRASLAKTGAESLFAFHILSDSNRPEIVAAELAAFGNQPGVTYRRRPANTGFKAGNLRDFACRALGEVEFMLALDADSLMSGPAILRLVQVMEANPRLGILQTLVTGLPATSAFARIFQFGMRHGMRTHTTGIAWWQGSSGPYWGHNALIRIAPFVAHCDLLVLPGRSPLAGPVLSHDQVEAALMRAAGWEVRVIADECGSWEENPPRLPDFIRRDLRWAQGNLQYLRLLGRPGLRPMGRFQLCNAVAMYLGAPASLLMLAVGLLRGLAGDQAAQLPQNLAFVLYFGFLLIGFAPRLLGGAGCRPAPRGASALGRARAPARRCCHGRVVHAHDRSGDDGGADALHRGPLPGSADHLGGAAARGRRRAVGRGCPRPVATAAIRPDLWNDPVAGRARGDPMGFADAMRLAARHPLRLGDGIAPPRALDGAERRLRHSG